MNFLVKLEKKIGKYAIKNLPMYMLATYAIGYIIQLINSDVTFFLSLNPYAILHGQVWRLFSWILIPPDSGNIIFTAIMLFFYFSISRTLEQTWGSFYFNLYIFMGLIFTVIGAFCMLGYSELFMTEKMAFVDANMQMTYGEIPAVYGESWFYATYSMLFSTYYVNMSIFLAYAATYPDMQVLIMFIIPVKVKYLGIIYSIILVLEAFGMGIMGLFVIGASLLNFVVFFIMTRKSLRISPKMRARQRDFKKRTAAAAQARQVAKHKCAICGRTAEEYPNLEFRFCSKCEGNYEFCQDHLFTHKHFKRSDK